MKLVIVESPSKAKTIEKYLGGDFTVRASVGHVRDLPKSNKQAVDIEAGFIPTYVIDPKKKQVLSDIGSLAKKADHIYLATDPDREGEAIAWHVQEALKLPLDKTSRVTFNEITKDAVSHALEHPRSIDEDLVKAQEARRVLDRLVGYDLSGLIWKKVRYGLSAGRVQSPALRILAEREREISSFISTPYWIISITGSTQKDESLTLTMTEKPTEESVVEDLQSSLEHASWSITNVAEKEVKRHPYPPFKTSTLQQTASTRLGFSPSRTMRIAQKLYEAGLITYMRTDSLNLSEQARIIAEKTAGALFGSHNATTRRYSTKSKNAQEAHEAIRPTDPSKQTAGITDEQQKLYSLIWTRTIASQMVSAETLRTTISANADGSDNIFSVTGSRILKPGWLLADTRARGEDVELPHVTQGETLENVTLETDRKETEPPKRYTEAGLIKELEKRGIGRPSTYASIISTLVDRGYVEKENRSLRTTDTGIVVSQFLEKEFERYINDSFTAEMEDELDQIARGEREYIKTLSSFYTPFSQEVKERSKSAEKITNLGEAPAEFPCPVCGSSMVIKLGKTGTFMSCSRFPECIGARTKEGVVTEENPPLGTDPETGLEVLVLEGPYGPYLQVGQKNDKNKKPRRASLPKEVDPSTITLEQALTLLSLPRKIGVHPETLKDIIANIGRFGPYIGHDSDFRSLKGDDDPYSITLVRSLEILAEPKKTRGRRIPKKKSTKK